MIDRTELLSRFSIMLDGIPVRWTDETITRGDFDGRDWTVDVFDVPASEQRAAVARLWPLRKSVRREHGVDLTFVFHTPEATTAHYAWVRQTQPLPIPVMGAGLLRPTFVQIGDSHAP